MQSHLITGIIFAIFCSDLFYNVAAVGSKTYETNDGFPTNFLNLIVNSDVVQKKINSRWRWQVWDVVPGTHAYKLNVFNITNPDEVEKGGKPTLQQVGPYYYKEYRYKFDVSVNLDLTVNWERNFSYTFDPSRSTGKESDTINMINVPLIIFATLASKNNPNSEEVSRAVSALVASGETIIKRNVKVGDILFNGIDVKSYQKYLNLMGPTTLLTKEFKDGLFSVLKLKNGVHEGQFTVDSGLINPKLVGNIVTYNGRSNLTYWKGDECNQLQGSDGSVFPPNLKHSDQLHMLEVDLCRSISLDYEEDVQFKSVAGNLFTISNDVLADPAKLPQNQCFCSEGKSCLKAGVLDVSSCQFGAPYVMSYAHFYGADPEYLQGVAGLSPDAKLHRTEVTVEPVTGAVIIFRKRYQWNIWVHPISGIDYFKTFSSRIVPILWNDDIFTLDPDKEELLMEELARLGGGMGSGTSKTLCHSIDTTSLALFIIIAMFVL